MKKSLAFFIILVVIVLSVIFILNNASSSDSIFKDPYTLFYGGDSRHFRANLFEANKTPIYPNESSIKDVLLSPEVYKVYIAFIPNEKENSYYLADSFEITNKLSLVYRYYITGQTNTTRDTDGSSCLLFLEKGKAICFKSYPINSTSELVPTPVEPVILLLGPSNSNQTAVTVKNNEIILEGKDFSQTDRNYNDLDLAVDKMLLVLMT